MKMPEIDAQVQKLRNIKRNAEWEKNKIGSFTFINEIIN